MEIDCQSLEGLFFKNFSSEQRGNQHWGQFRFSVIGELLSSPPAKGQLLQTIQRLSQKIYQHPINEDQRFTVGASTIERWYYKAKEVDDPVAVPGRKSRSDAGIRWSMPQALLDDLIAQHQKYPKLSLKPEKAPR